MISGTPDSIEMPIYTVAKCLNELIVNNNQEEAMHRIATWLRDSLDIDSCFIIEHSTLNDILRGSNVRRPHFQKHTINFQNAPAVLDALQHNRAFKVSINNHISNDIQQMLQQLQVHSILLIPVYWGDHFFGAIGFGDSQFARTWRNSEMELQSLATAIGVSVLKGVTKKDLPKKNEALLLPGTLKEVSWQYDVIHNNLRFNKSVKPVHNVALANGKWNMETWITQFVHLQDQDRVLKKLTEFINDKHNYTEEDVCRVINPQTGKYVWMLSRVCLRRNASGSAISLSGVTTNISDTSEVINQLKNRQEQYEFLVQSLAQVIFTLDCDGKCSFVSNAWQQVMGGDCDSTVGEPFIQFIASDYIYNFWVSFGKLTSGKVASIDEKIKMVHADGTSFWVRWIARSSRDGANRISGIYGTIENIDVSQSEEELRNDANEKINTILNNSKEIILTINLAKNSIENVNEAIGLLGYRPSEWIGKNLQLWNDNKRQEFYQLMKLAIKSELKVQNQQIAIENKTGTESVTFEFSTSIFYFKNEKYLLCVLRDIRERIKYQENINRISKQLNNLINSIDDVYAIYDVEKEAYDFVSDNVETLYETSKEIFMADTRYWKSVIHPKDLERVEQELEAIPATRHKCEIFYRALMPGGDYKIILEKVIVGLNDQGQITKYYIVKTDYTHIEEAKQSLLDTERKFNFISENISDFISIHDADWNYVYASPSIKNIFGYEPAEILGKGGFDFVHPDDLVSTLDEALEPIVMDKRETRFRYRMVTSDGNYKWVETYSKPVVNEDGKTTSILSTTRDVTDQVLAQNKLKVSEEKYRLLSENSNDIIAIHTLKGEYLYISPSCKLVLGYGPSIFLGKTPDQVFDNNNQGESVFQNNIAELLRCKKQQKFIKKIKTASGETRSLEILITPVIKENEIVSIQSASRDVTEREALMNELKVALAKERELNELRSMFVSTASHQFRTPLTIIQSGVEIMDMYVEELSEEKQHKFKKQFNSIHKEIERLEFLMNDVLLLGRANAARTPFNPRVEDLVLFCTKTIEERFNSRYGTDRRVKIDIIGEPEMVSFDSKLLGHVIENVLGNAYKYSATGNPEMCITFGPHHVTLAIKDKGIGIPDEEIKNLFQPFYRAGNTDEIEGTGLGLAIVKEFVDKHGGKINILSKLNKGTTVSVILPVHPKK